MIGFIGAGNMGFAILKGMLEKGINPQEICVYDKNISTLEKLKALGITILNSSLEVARKSNFLFIAVKPNIYDAVLNEVKDTITNDKIVITIAAGYEVSKVQNILGDKKIVRTMPNTPALSLEGFTAIYFNEHITDNEKNEVSF